MVKVEPFGDDKIMVMGPNEEVFIKVADLLKEQTTYQVINSIILSNDRTHLVVSLKTK